MFSHLKFGKFLIFGLVLPKNIGTCTFLKLVCSLLRLLSLAHFIVFVFNTKYLRVFFIAQKIIQLLIIVVSYVEKLNSVKNNSISVLFCNLCICKYFVFQFLIQSAIKKRIYSNLSKFVCLYFKWLMCYTTYKLNNIRSILYITLYCPTWYVPINVGKGQIK